MTLITAVHAQTTAAPDAIFAVWADMARWPEWNSDTEWVRLDGAFEQGARGRLKPAGAPSVPFVVSRLEPGRRFTDVSRLWGARLTFDHRIIESETGRLVQLTIELTGPLHRLWRRLMGAGLISSAQVDLDALVRRAEAVAATTARIAR